MALVLADRVQETSTSTGTGSFTLAGAVTGYQSFAVIGNGNTTYYTIADQGGTNWEVGIGTYSTTGPTLARTTVLSSSNAGALVPFPAGIKTVFVTYPSEKSVNLNAAGNVSALGTVSSGVWQGTAVDIAHGGTGQNNAAAAFDALSPITTVGDLIVGDGTNSATRIAVGTSGQVLTSNGTTVFWDTPDIGGGTITTTDFTATAGQTVFTVPYTVGSTQVYQNGVKLGIDDFTATNGTSITLAVPATLGDLIEVVTFSVLNLYSTITSESFSGNGVQIVFTMSAVPANTASLLVAISGVVQDPTTYTVSSNTLTFLTAPPAGSNNISVRYLGVASIGTVSSFSGGTTGLTPASATTGAVVLGGTLSIANGGTGATTQAGAANAILPTQSGNNGRYLTTDGTNTSWGVVTSNPGTVTSVNLTAGTGVSVSGGPITSSGSITVNNTGVTSIVAGSGISISGATGGVTISASGGGVTSLNGQTGAITNTSFNTIGSYFAGAQNTPSVVGPNSTVGGGSLFSPTPITTSAFASMMGSNWSGAGLSGTWRSMARSNGNNDCGNNTWVGNLWVRIS